MKRKASSLMKPATSGPLLRNTGRKNQGWHFALSTHEHRREVRRRGLGARDFSAPYFLAKARPARFFWSFSFKEKDESFVVEDEVSDHKKAFPGNSDASIWHWPVRQGQRRRCSRKSATAGIS
jgi:hypothetical protein